MSYNYAACTAALVLVLIIVFTYFQKDKAAPYHPTRAVHAPAPVQLLQAAEDPGTQQMRVPEDAKVQKVCASITSKALQNFPNTMVVVSMHKAGLFNWTATLHATTVAQPASTSYERVGQVLMKATSSSRGSNWTQTSGMYASELLALEGLERSLDDGEDPGSYRWQKTTSSMELSSSGH